MNVFFSKYHAFFDMLQVKLKISISTGLVFKKYIKMDVVQRLQMSITLSVTKTI